MMIMKRLTSLTSSCTASRGLEGLKPLKLPEDPPLKSERVSGVWRPTPHRSLQPLWASQPCQYADMPVIDCLTGKTRLWKQSISVDQLHWLTLAFKTSSFIVKRSEPAKCLHMKIFPRLQYWHVVQLTALCSFASYGTKLFFCRCGRQMACFRCVCTCAGVMDV